MNIQKYSTLLSFDDKYGDSNLLPHNYSWFYLTNNGAGVVNPIEESKEFDYHSSESKSLQE